MRKLLTVVGVVAGCIAMASWIPLAEVEDRALLHPDHATAAYTVPLHIKGVVRYVTPDQKWWDQIGQLGFWGGWLIAISAGGTLQLLKNRSPKP
jgi:hypothetical protein